MLSEKLIPYLPDPADCDPWQRLMREEMIALADEAEEAKATYRWDNEARQGVLAPVIIGGETIARESKTAPAVYCCGTVLEIVLRTWKRYFGGDGPLTPALAREWKAFLFVHEESDRRYDRGGQAFLPQLEGLVPFTIAHTVPLAEARFGDMVQIQNKPNIHESGGGHAGIFLKHLWIDKQGQEEPLLYESNLRHDLTPTDQGIGVSWFASKRERDGFARRFWIGGFRNVPERSVQSTVQAASEETP